MGKDIINILIACDKNYAQYYGVMLTSLFANNRECGFHIYWITDGSISQKDKAIFNKLVTKYKSYISIYEIDNKCYANYPQSGHINCAAYYNLNASKILPEEVHRIIYMDGDMVVNGDIRPLWEIDLHENVCAQVLGAAYYDEEQYERLGYDKKYGVYNNGVTVYDFDKLRQMDFSNKALQFIMDNPEKVTWMDQDVINIFLHDKTLRLSYRYNFQTLALTQERWQHYDDAFRREVLSESSNPIVVHYTGHIKPWQIRYYGFPFGSLWDKYWRQSDWHEAKQRRPIKQYAKYLIKRLIHQSSFRNQCNDVYIKEAWALR